VVTKATANETKERTTEAAKLLARKIPPAQIKIELATKYQITIRQAGNIVKKAQSLLYDSLGREDIKNIFLSTLECCMEDRLDAQQAGNHSAQVGASKTMAKLLSLLPAIDQQTMWDAEHDALYETWCQEISAPPKGKIPREKINLKKDVGKLSPELPDLPLPDDNSADNIPW